MGQHAASDEQSMLVRAEETLRQIADRLADSLRFEVAPARHPGADALVSLGTHEFILECKWASDSASVVGAISKLIRTTQVGANRRPLLCVSHMGPAGRRLCEDADLSWFDLSGNADVLARDLYIHVEGRKNRFQRPGRPGGFFAPRASRIARWLLMEHPKGLSYRELVGRSGLGKGFVSRILGQMVTAGLASKDSSNVYHALDPTHLLAAWSDTYDFDKHFRLAGVVQPAPGPMLLRRVVANLQAAGSRAAATGLGAAWARRKFADFRLATVYVDRLPATSTLDSMGFREESRGANVWIVVPADAGVFDGSSRVDDVDCVHPVQVLLDLKAQPERAPEASDDLRSWLREKWRA